MAKQPTPQRGYELLTGKAFLPPDFDQEIFDQLWTVWEKPLREEAAAAKPDRRRQMAYQRYGLIPNPDPEKNGPLQYVVSGQGQWAMNCLACHQGQLDGEVIPGLPNSQYALSTLTDDVRAVKLRLKRPLARMDMGSLFMPLGNSRGTTNAVMFGVVLMHYRDAQLNVYQDRQPPVMVHHDLDAPAWWHFRKKTHLYYDGFVPKSHRALMQFLLVPENGPDAFRQWEQDYRSIFAWMESLEAPPYPHKIGRDLAESGRKIFDMRCAKCHGTYGEQETYPNKVVDIKVVGTDRVRLESLTPVHRRRYGESWFAEFGKQDVVLEPSGYVAPPLDGIWASAPYLHNGSVPTLWHLLNADDRPRVWRRNGEGYNTEQIGLNVSTFDELPSTAKSLSARREYFDTRLYGKGSGGHLFPEKLSPTQKRAVLEYLKTL